MDRRDLFINDLYACQAAYGIRGVAYPLTEFSDRSDLDCYRLLSFAQPRGYNGKVDSSYRGRVYAVQVDPVSAETIGREKWVRLNNIVAPWGDFVEFSEPTDSIEAKIVKAARVAIKQVDEQTTEDAQAAVGRLTRLVFPNLTDRYRDPATRVKQSSYNSDGALTSDLNEDISILGYELAALLHLATGLDITFPSEVAQHRLDSEAADKIIEGRKAQRRTQFREQEQAWEQVVRDGRAAAKAAGKRYRQPRRPSRPPYIYTAPDEKGPPITAL